MGPTAVGKSDAAEHLAESLEAQLVSADAFQAYRLMDIGTAKPVRKHLYRLVDFKDPHESYGVGEFVQLAVPELENCFEQGRNVVVVGGTGLYIRALFEEYADLLPEPDPEVRRELRARCDSQGVDSLAAELRRLAPDLSPHFDVRNPVRVIRALEKLMQPLNAITVRLPSFRKAKFGLDVATEVLDGRISQRTQNMVHNGWVGEVQHLLSLGYGALDPGFQAIGYRNILLVVEGTQELDEAVANTVAETRRYAKRQRTWLRSEPNLAHIVLSGDEDPKNVARRIGSCLS